MHDLLLSEFNHCGYKGRDHTLHIQAGMLDPSVGSMLEMAGWKLLPTDYVWNDTGALFFLKYELILMCLGCCGGGRWKISLMGN